MKLNGVGKTMKHFKNISYASSTLYHHFRFRHEAPIFWFAIAFSWPLALHCLWHRQLFCLVSLACEQAPQVGGGGGGTKKRGQTGKISANEASPAVAWGEAKGGNLSRPQSIHRLSSLADFFLFPPMRSLVPGYIIFYFSTQREKWKSEGIDYLYLPGIGSECSFKKLERKLASSRNSFSSPLIFMAFFNLLGAVSICQNWSARTFPS